MSIDIGFQLYSARNKVAESMEQVLRQLSEIGYDGVEFAGFFGHSAEEILNLLKKYNLKAVSSHINLNDLNSDFTNIVAFHKAIACNRIVVPYTEDGFRPCQAGFSNTIRNLFNIGLKLKNEGLSLYYHNHDFEFVKLCNGVAGLDFMYDAIDESLLKCEIDVCWTSYAGLDPAKYLIKYKNRCELVHVKDYVCKNMDTSPYGLIGKYEVPKLNESFMFKPFGYGSIDASAIIKAAKEANTKWLIVEQDENYNEDPLYNAKLSFETVKRLLDE